MPCVRLPAADQHSARDDPSDFTNMWNLMDWSGFLLFIVLFAEFHMLHDSLRDSSCNDQALEQ